MINNIRELRDKQDEEKQDSVWLARYLGALDDVEEIIRNKIKELEGNKNSQNQAQLKILKELLGE